MWMMGLLLLLSAVLGEEEEVVISIVVDIFGLCQDGLHLENNQLRLREGMKEGKNGNRKMKRMEGGEMRV